MTGSAAVVAQDGSSAATPAVSGSGIDRTASWLLSQQADDGGFAGPSGESDPGATLDALIALAAAEHAGIDTGDAIERAVAWLESGDVALVYVQTGVGQAAKLALGLSAVGVPPSGFANVDPIAVVQNGVDPDTGLYSAGVYDHALAVLALLASGNEVPAAAIEAFAATQAENGGWAFDASTDPAMADSNTTSLAIQALVAAGVGESGPVANGLAYLDAVWLDGGAGYSTLPETLPDANSTALLIQAFVAAGRDVSAPIEALAAFQNASGAFHFNAEDTSDNLYATSQAIPALAQIALPIDAAGPDATPVAIQVSRVA
ncbi:MAG: hypothetical protein H0T72_10880 [Chloroflexia bacterium]|nr:hypothetical protein [Chloroflexia bacterium]